jgi:hypothetical protein
MEAIRGQIIADKVHSMNHLSNSKLGDNMHEVWLVMQEKVPTDELDNLAMASSQKQEKERHKLLQIILAAE